MATRGDLRNQIKTMIYYDAVKHGQFEKAHPHHMSSVLLSEEIGINISCALPYEAKMASYSYQYYFKDDVEDTWFAEELWATEDSCNKTKKNQERNGYVVLCAKATRHW